MDKNLLRRVNLNKIFWNLSQKYPIISKVIHPHDGYIHEELKGEDWIFGATGIVRKVLREDGQYDNYLPQSEKQQGRNGIDTLACTNFSLANVIEILCKVIWNILYNKNDSFNAVGSGTNPNRGNSMANAADSVRKNNGMINETDRPLPLDFTLQQFYAPHTLEQITKGKLWLNEYKMNYEAVQPTIYAMKEALKYSPLYVAGYAWYLKDGYYRSYSTANHAFVIYGYVDGQYWKAFDTYEPFEKKLAWDFKFAAVKTIFLQKGDPEYNQVEIEKLKERGLKYIMRVLNHGEIYELLENKLQYLSPDDWNKKNVQEKTNKELIGITEDFFAKLYK